MLVDNLPLVKWQFGRTIAALRGHGWMGEWHRDVDSEDLLSICVLNMAACVHKFDPARDILLSSYASKATDRTLRKHVHRARTRMTKEKLFLDGEEPLNIPPSGHGPSESLGNAELFPKLLAVAKECLSEYSFEILRMYVFDNASVREVGRRIGATKQFVSEDLRISCQIVREIASVRGIL